MAQIDVTELFVDADFVDEMAIVRRTAAVNAAGENVIEECTIATIGSIQPASGKTLKRLPESLQLADVSDFWVQGEIRVAGKTAYPDILVFKKKRYQVQTVQDWQNFGGGWCQGTCVVEKPDGT